MDMEEVLLNIICLPVYLTEKSKFKLIRFIGVLLMLVWFFIVFPIIMLFPIFIIWKNT